MSKSKVKAKRALTVTMSLALGITLSACSGATNNYGSLDSNSVYASAGTYEVTKGELWDELKWNAQSLLSEQIENVVLDEQITNLRNVFEKTYTELSTTEKEDLGVSDEAGFNSLYEKYKKRFIDYVVQDVFSFTYSTEDYWDNVENLDETDAKTLIYKYVDTVFTTYHKEALEDGTTYLNLLLEAYENGAEDNKMNFFEFGLSLKEKFYPLYAKELLAYQSLKEEVDKAAEEDTDEDDNMIGYYENTSYVNKFKSEYTNKYDLDLILIRFASSDEYNNTLRAFGVKVYNKRYYFIRDNADDGYDSYLESENKLSLTKYNELYDGFSTSQLTKENGAYELTSEEVLELFIQIYNYSYSGYRSPLASTVITKNTVLHKDVNGNDVLADYANLSLNNLRDVTYSITKEYASNATEKYEANIESLKENNKTETTFYSDDLKNDYSDSFRVYMYETLLLTDDQGYQDLHARYTTTTQSANSAQYAIYKFGEEKNFREGEEVDDETLLEYQNFYKSSLSKYEILSYIQDDSRKVLFETILDLLMHDDITSNKISTVLSDETENVKVSIYNEAVEIGYKKDNSDYSNTILSAANNNILATLSYDDKTWNLNIVGDANDENSLKVAGYDTPYSAYDVLERQNGISVASSLLSRKIVKDTKTYKDTLNEKDTRESYKNYLENMLIYFSNDYYSSSGYPSSIGKYNFLMLYFHTADVNSIIENTYLLSLATSRLLTDYSSDTLASFFKEYADLAYDKYFSMESKTLLVYFDRDDDDEPDEVDVDDPNNWIFDEVSFDGDFHTRGYVAKSLIYDVYQELAASSTAHSDYLDTLVTEINNSSKAVYEENPISSENKWAKYRYLGFKVKTVTNSVTNATTQIDFDLKQRLFDYAKGSNDDGTKTYQYFINDSIPTSYMEILSQDNVAENDDTILRTVDGYNLNLITTGTAKSSAKWSEDDYKNTELLENIWLKYNEKYVKVDNVYNEDDKLSLNQILLYVLDQAVNGSSTLSPAAINDALTNYLSPVYTRFTSDATQSIVLLNFIKKATNSEAELYDVIKYNSDNTYNGVSGKVARTIIINEDVADSYSRYINDTTGTSDTFENWWEKLYEQVANFLSKKEEDK